MAGGGQHEHWHHPSLLAQLRKASTPATTTTTSSPLDAPVSTPIDRLPGQEEPASTLGSILLRPYLLQSYYPQSKTLHPLPLLVVHHHHHPLSSLHLCPRGLFAAALLHVWCVDDLVTTASPVNDATITIGGVHSEQSLQRTTERTYRTSSRHQNLHFFVEESNQRLYIGSNEYDEGKVPVY